MADALVERTDEVLAANAADVEAAAAEAGRRASVLDRLRLDAGRMAGVAAALRELVALPDPVGDVVRGSHAAQRAAAAPGPGAARAWSASSTRPGPT